MDRNILILQKERVIVLNPLNALKDTNPERGANVFSLGRIPTVLSGHKVLSEFGELRLGPL